MLQHIRAVVAIAVACSLMHLVACGSKQPATDSLPSLAGLDDRLVSSTADVTATGSETLARSAGAVEQGTNLLLESDEDSMEWAIYRLQPPGVMIPQSATVTLAADSTDEAWVAVGDFVSLRWEFSGPYAAPAEISGLDSNYVSPNGYVYIAVVVSGAHAAMVEGVSQTSEGNLPPVASFDATPQSGVPLTPVTLDASGSSDADGSIAQYEWDLDGDGVFELDNGDDPMASTTLPNPAGTVTVGLRVTDIDGANATTTLELTSEFTSDWTIVVVDIVPAATDHPYFHNSVAVINGKPAISYYDSSNFDLKFAISSEADGATGWTTRTVDADGNVGQLTSLAEVDGKPAISYAGGGGVKYAYSSTADGGGNWTTMIVDGSVSSYPFPSLAEVEGNPALSYYGDSDLMYAYSSTADASSGWTTLIVDDLSWLSGHYSSLAVVDGKPAIGYHDQQGSSSELKYAYSSAADGSGGWTSLTLDSGGAGASLELVNGKPAIGYVDENYDLKYAHSSTADGSSGWSSLAVDETGALGGGTSLAVIDGKPAIGCLNGSNTQVRYAVSLTADGSGEWTSSLVDVGDVNWPILTEVNGNPAIVYASIGEFQYELRYAVLLP